jgi:hypothetical protein
MRFVDDDALVPGDAAAPEPAKSTEDSKFPISDFHPIRISGEPLSATVIRERRERPW